MFSLLEILLPFLMFIPPTTLPAGTNLEVRLTTKVASDSSKANDPVEAVVIAPVMLEGKILIPTGTLVKGTVKEVHSVDDTHARAGLRLEFATLADKNGKTMPIPTQVVDVDNARETVDSTGQIIGILSTESLSSRMDQGLERLATRLGGLAAVLQTAKKSMVQQANPEIAYQPGIEIRLKLPQAVTLQNLPEASADSGIQPIESEDDLVELVRSQPFQTFAEKPPKPSDITNLMFLGSREQIEKAFAEAGWSTAAELTRQSQIETIRAIAENRGYSEAPVSLLLLDEQKPDLVFQKQNNTFAKRHHLRVWRRPGSFLGRDIWVSSATHDTGIDFSPENRTFIHKIDSHIDVERAKVVTDLLFTGKIEGLSLIARPAVPNESKNATGDDLLTDGAMGVLLFSESAGR